MSDATEKVSRLRYYLGGIPATRWLSRRRAVAMVALGILGVVILAALIQTRSTWLILALAIVFGIGWLTYTKKTASGGQWVVDVLSKRLRKVFARMGRWDEFDPEFDDRPWFIEDYSVLAVTANEDDDEDSGLCLIDTGKENMFVAVVEVDGNGQSIRPDYQHNQLERNFHTFMDNLCDPKYRVAQVDLITKISPEGGDPFIAWTDKHLREEVLNEDAVNADGVNIAKESMYELARGSELLSSQVRSWAVLVMPIDGLVRYIRDLRLTVSPELLAEAAAETVSDVTRMMMAHGIRIHQGLSPRQVSAVIRGIMCPEFSVDDTEGIEGFWSGWAGFQPSSRGTSLITYPVDRESMWYHRSAVIPRDAFPQDSWVTGRWLEPIVLESEVPYRVISTKFRLFPHHEARLIAKDQLTSAASQVIRQRRSGKVSDGETEDNQSLAQRVTYNIRRQGKGGVIPIVRVMVSARSERLVNRAAEQMVSEVQKSMGVLDVVWDVPALGMLATLPLGIGVNRK